MALTNCFLLLAVISTAVAQFVTPPPAAAFTNATGYAGVNVRYKEVPTGICELDPNVKSYSGYADVSENQHIFFWFFEARTVDPKEAPLTVWINGGPGSSSMLGLFQENGPCRVNKDGVVDSNPYSWSNASNMLYIDQPTQVGFSYSIPINGYVNASGAVIPLPNAICPDAEKGTGTCGTFSDGNPSLTAKSTSDAAPNFWKTLQGFMGVFPQYSRKGFHFASESYGGHFGPLFNDYIETQNALKIPGAHEISLETVMIGNGWYDPLIQYQAYYNFTVFPGNTYDYSPFNASLQSSLYDNLYGPGNCVDQIKKCAAGGIDAVCTAADNYCGNFVEGFYDYYLNRDEYDIRELKPDPFPYNYYSDYLNTAEVQAAIGAYQNFSMTSRTVVQTFTSTGDDNRELGTVEALKKLLDQGIYVFMYSGDADYNCNWLGGEVVAHEVNAPGFDSAGYTNISTSDNVIHGQVKQAGKFAFSRIYESGHEVPFYQPLVSLEIFERAINGKDIATGNTAPGATYSTQGTERSTFREGNSTMQFEVLPADSTYDTTTNGPKKGAKSRKRARMARG